jgi:hypothetical protein
MWAHVVTAALLNGLDQFELARIRYNRLATRRSLFEVGCLLRRMVGPSAAASVLQTSLRSKRGLRVTMTSIGWRSAANRSAA